MTTTNRENTALFIGRFQPPHHGHLDAIKQIVSDDISKVLLGIGSANKEHTSDNPFTYNERKELMTRLLEELDADVEVEMYPIPDFNNNDAWLSFIEGNIPEFGTIYTGNPWVQDIFEKKGVQVKDVVINKNIKGTFMRNQIAMQRYGLLEKSTTPGVVDYIKEIKGHERLSEVYEQEMVGPKVAADLILEDQDDNIVLIWRKYSPHGLALPGGFVNYGEEPSKAAIREGYEELFNKEDGEKNIELYGDGHTPLQTKTDPDRDPRGHVITFAFAGKMLDGKLEANDDADGLHIVSKKDVLNIPRDKFAFPDHQDILLSYLGAEAGALQQ